MDYDVDDHPAVRVIRFAGDLGSHDDPELKRMFVGLANEKRVRVAADMSKVTFLDSTALGTLVWGMKNLREADGDFRMFALQGFVERLFHLTSLDQAFRIFETEEQCVRSYG